MNLRIPLWSLALCLGLQSCAVVSSPEFRATALQTATTVGARRLLADKPSAVSLVRDLAAAIDAATSKDVTLTPANIRAFVERTCAPHGSAADVAAWTDLALGIHRAYVDSGEIAVVQMADPRVLRYVRAFQRGLANAVNPQ
jgi:hypothetical protein